ncbi:MAG: Uncharacterized protein FD123_184 [Bacteroidetes bacterium]|nr:MAG: Uncharacterized protein FD123_184 [Bacteroidota bacterium]
MTPRIFFLLLFFLFSAITFAQKRPNLIPYRKGDLWGYADSTKKIIITPKYDRCFPFVNGKALAETKDSKFIQIDSTGKIVKTFTYKLHEYMRDGMLKISVNYSEEGIIDISGAIVMPPKYLSIEILGPDSFEVTLPGKKGTINRAGKELVKFIPFETDMMDTPLTIMPSGDCDKPCFWSSFSEGMAVVAHKGTFGYADTSRRVKISCKYQMAESFLHGLGRVVFEKPGQVITKPYKDANGEQVVTAVIMLDGYVDRFGNEYWEE